MSRGYTKGVRKPLFAVSILLAVLLGYFLYPLRSGEDKMVVAFGDSLVYGTGSSAGGGFVALVSRELGVPIENLGVPGNTTLDALKRLDEVITRNPDIVIVLLGGNDVLRGMPAAETARNLELIVDTLENSGSEVLLLDLGILEGIWGNPAMMSDNLHPNDRGYRLMAERVAPSLKILLK